MVDVLKPVEPVEQTAVSRFFVPCFDEIAFARRDIVAAALNVSTIWLPESTREEARAELRAQTQKLGELIMQSQEGALVLAVPTELSRYARLARLESLYLRDRIGSDGSSTQIFTVPLDAITGATTHPYIDANRGADPTLNLRIRAEEMVTVYKAGQGPEQSAEEKPHEGLWHSFPLKKVRIRTQS